MYKPTEEELQELGFYKVKTYTKRRFVKDTKYDQISCEIYRHEKEESHYIWQINVNLDGIAQMIFYPASRQDVETLIRMLTNN